MYPGSPPQQIVLDVRTELPAELRIAHTPERHNFPEGPSFGRGFHSSGDVYFTAQGRTGLQDPTERVWRLRAGHQLKRVIDTVPRRLIQALTFAGLTRRSAAVSGLGGGRA